MNFRELFSKLDELANVPAGNDPVANKMSQSKNAPVNTAMRQDEPMPAKDIPGSQPQLGPKPVTVAPAVPQGYKQPEPQVVPDAKSDVNAMAAALKAMMSQQKMTQPVGLQTPPTSSEKTKISAPTQQPVGKPGEPLEEAAELPKGFITRGDYNKRRQEWVAQQRIYDALSPLEKAGTRNPQKDWDNFENTWKAQVREIDKSLAVWKSDIANAKTPEEKKAVINSAPEWFRPTIIGALSQQDQALINPPPDATTSARQEDPNKTKPQGDGKTTPQGGNQQGDGKTTPQGGKDNKTTPTAGDGPTGKELAALGVTKAQRRDQAFVDQQFGKDKFTAGTAASNLALLDKAKKGEIKSSPAPAPAPAPSPAPAPAPAASGDGQGPRPNTLGVVAQPGEQVAGPANTAPAAAPADPVAAARERQAQAAKDAELVRQADIIAKYGNLDPTKVQTRTGNVNKPWYELKTGDIDYDKDGRKIVYTKDPTGGPGQWSAGSWKDHTSNPFSKETPGVFFGPSYDSDEGKKFVQAYRDRTVNPDEYDVLKKHWEKNPPKGANSGAVGTAAKEGPVVQGRGDVKPEVDDALTTRGRNAATTPESKGWNPALMVDVNGQRVWDPTNISKLMKEELHSKLSLIAEELINKKI